MEPYQKVVLMEALCGLVPVIILTIFAVCAVFWEAIHDEGDPSRGEVKYPKNELDKEFKKWVKK